MSDFYLKFKSYDKNDSNFYKKYEKYTYNCGK
jgi:hypothetical protein